MAAVVVGAGLVAGLASMLERAEAQPAGRVVDRSFLCATSLSGGIHEIEVRAHGGVGAGGTRWAQLPFAVVSSGNPTITGNLLRPDTLAFVTAGRPTSATTIDQDFRKSKALQPGRIAINTRACRPTTRKVPLTRAGLQGGTASLFGDELDCEVPRRVLLRVRAVLTRPGGFERIRRFERLSTPVEEAQLMTRTERGRGIMHAQVSLSGRTTLASAVGICAPD